MQLTFLAASMPLVKKFSLQGEKLVQQSYPHAFNFTSHTYEVKTLNLLLKYMTKHAALGHCLLKGELRRELHNESRAGSTDTNTPTWTLVLDLDGIKDLNDIEDFLALLPKELQNTSYILQHSASAGLKPGLRVHLIFLLAAPVSPQLIKQWLTRLNLDTPKLRSQLTLTRSLNALKWPLDITVGQNDKLIYIAPPELGPGVADPFAATPRIQLVRKRHGKLDYDFSNVQPGALRHDTDTAINEVREHQGLPKRRATKDTQVNGVVVSKATEQPEITGIKTERGFTYLNLNGGDSWGYYHPEDNPEIIYNFKGEPNYLTKELLPTYFAEASVNAPLPPLNEVNTDVDETGTQYFAFIEPHSDVYYKGQYNAQADLLEYHTTSKRQHVYDFLNAHSQPLPDFFDEWKVEFDFSSDTRIDFDNRILNTYRPTKYFTNPPGTRFELKVPETIHKIIFHATGSDTPSYKAFMNWLAVITQHRIKTGMAWILHGVQGTGKGVMFHYIIQELFGQANCARTDMSTIATENFNGFLENAVFCLIDEAQTEDIKDNARLNARLKENITEPLLSIRKMRTDSYLARSFVNFLIFSNEPGPAHISGDDRRMSVAARQEIPIDLSYEEIQAIHAELPQFFYYLQHCQCNMSLAQRPLNNDARRVIQNLSRDTNEEVVDRLKHGDLSFFYHNRPTAEQSYELMKKTNQQLPKYHEVLITCLDEPFKIDRNALHTLFYYTTGNLFATPHKFTKFLSHKGLETKRMRIGTQIPYGYEITGGWRTTPELVRAIRAWHAERTENQV